MTCGPPAGTAHLQKRLAHRPARRSAVQPAVGRQRFKEDIGNVICIRALRSIVTGFFIRCAGPSPPLPRGRRLPALAFDVGRRGRVVVGSTACRPRTGDRSWLPITLHHCCCSAGSAPVGATRGVRFRGADVAFYKALGSRSWPRRRSPAWLRSISLARDALCAQWAASACIAWVFPPCAAPLLSACASATLLAPVQLAFPGRETSSLCFGDPFETHSQLGSRGRSLTRSPVSAAGGGEGRVSGQEEANSHQR